MRAILRVELHEELTRASPTRTSAARRFSCGQHYRAGAFSAGARLSTAPLHRRGRSSSPTRADDGAAQRHPHAAAVPCRVGHHLRCGQFLPCTWRATAVLPRVSPRSRSPLIERPELEVEVFGFAACASWLRTLLSRTSPGSRPTPRVRAPAGSVLAINPGGLESRLNGVLRTATPRAKRRPTRRSA
jgi:hypothetical protein